MGKQKRNRSPAYSDRVIVENCINAYIDGGNNIQAMWDYLRLLIGRGDITEPYAKVKAKESLDCIKSTERLTRNWK